MNSKTTRKKFEEIKKRTPETLSAEEERMLAEAEEMDDGTVVSYEELKKELGDYSGKLVLRIPKSLHRHLKKCAEIEGVSLNQYMLYKLSK